MNEFTYAGEVTSRPAPSQQPPPLPVLTAYLYLRRNVAGVQQEWWCHRDGCRLWFQAQRDTRTNEVERVFAPEKPEPEAAS